MEQLSEFILNHWILSTLFVVLSWLVLSDTFNRKLSGIEGVSTAYAIQMANQQQGMFLDIREASEFNKEHIADSINMPLSQISEQIASFNTSGNPVILVCNSGQRARTAAKQLRAAGISKLYVLNGGLNSWKDAKLPLFS